MAKTKAAKTRVDDVVPAEPDSAAAVPALAPVSEARAAWLAAVAAGPAAVDAYFAKKRGA